MLLHRAEGPAGRQPPRGAARGTISLPRVSPVTGTMPPTTSVDAAAAATTVPAEDEVPQCPLCLEDLDATDLSVRACQCGYPVCVMHVLYLCGVRASGGCAGGLGDDGVAPLWTGEGRNDCFTE